MIRISPDYQHHVEEKRKAIPLPELKGKTVLDIGCDHGQWSFLAASLGASEVLGIDRNRDVRGQGFTDLVKENNGLAIAYDYQQCHFKEYDIGKQWPDLGRFDVVFLFSLYHHIYENCGDHNAIWYWLWLQTKGELLWENPINAADKVVQCNVSKDKHNNYNLHEIQAAALTYFYIEYLGPAIHEPHREVWRCLPKSAKTIGLAERGYVRTGAGGASKAFAHQFYRRSAEIKTIVGWWPQDGTLNLQMDSDFDFDKHYLRAQILDVVERGKGLDVDWQPRWCRFYPLMMDGEPAMAMRFEGEKYPLKLVELISSRRLRDEVETGEEVILCRP